MYNCTVRGNSITTLGLSLSGTIAIEQGACNRFLLIMAKKKIRQVRGLSHYSIIYINCWTMHILPDPGPLLIAEARGLASDSETLCLGGRYRTQRLPGTRPRDTEYYLFILFIFCVKLHYSRCSPLTCPLTGLPKNARTTH